MAEEHPEDLPVAEKDTEDAPNSDIQANRGNCLLTPSTISGACAMNTKVVTQESAEDCPGCETVEKGTPSQNQATICKKLGVKAKGKCVRECQSEKENRKSAVLGQTPEEAFHGVSQMSRTCVEVDDAEVARRAREEGCVAVVFPGSVTQDSCCRFVSEILKCVLYQRQQLPMTYDQLVYFQRKQEASRAEELVSRRPTKTSSWDGRKCQRTLQELEEVLHNLEVLFSLSAVPRVLLLLGGSLTLPKELYEINMEALVGGSCERTLRTGPCLRQLFRALFVADFLSDPRSVHLVATTVVALGHRDCGVGWFRPKLDFRVPGRVKRQIISLSSDPSLSKSPLPNWEDYVWFQAPITIKGFCK